MKLLINCNDPLMSVLVWTFLSRKWKYIWLIKFPYTSSVFRPLIYKLHVYQVTQKWHQKSLPFVRHFIPTMVQLFTLLCEKCSVHLIFYISTTNRKSCIILINFQFTLLTSFSWETTHLPNFSFNLRKNTGLMFNLSETGFLP